MLEEYIKETVKKELAKQKLNGMYGKNKQQLTQQNEKLIGDKKVLKDALEESNNYVIFLGQENEKLKKELRDSKNGLNFANDIIKNMKQKNKKLNEKLDGIKFVTRKRCVRPLTYDNLKKAIILIENILKES